MIHEIKCHITLTKIRLWNMEQRIWTEFLLLEESMHFLVDFLQSFFQFYPFLLQRSKQCKCIFSFDKNYEVFYWPSGLWRIASPACEWSRDPILTFDRVSIMIIPQLCSIIIIINIIQTIFDTTDNNPPSHATILFFKQNQTQNVKQQDIFFNLIFDPQT